MPRNPRTQRRRRPLHLGRIATILWPDQQLVRYRSVAAAVNAIRIDQTYRLG